MKITKRQLKRIIREEHKRILSEGVRKSGWDGNYGDITSDEGERIIQHVSDYLSQAIEFNNMELLGKGLEPRFWVSLAHFIAKTERVADKITNAGGDFLGYRGED